MVEPWMVLMVGVLVVVVYALWVNSRNWEGVRWALQLKGYDEDTYRLARSFWNVATALLFVAALPDRGARGR